MKKTVKFLAPAVCAAAIIFGAGAIEASAADTCRTEIYIATPSGLPDNDELAQRYLDKMFGGVSFPALYSNYGSQILTGAQRELYTLFKAEIEKVAAGTRTNTQITVHPSFDVYTSGFNSQKLTELLRCLLMDCPESFYWYDKTSTGACGAEIDKGTNTVTLRFSVAKEYSAANTYKTYTVNPSKINAAKAAVSNAKAIAAKYAGKTDEEKILGFRNEICALTEYNHDALADGTAYGDPWQMVYVFDGNPNTNVVCEGYAKAFQYLCDQSGIESYIVNGDMNGGTGAGGHMWNVVVLDGKSYLVDITNCDSGTIGYPENLLLKGASSSSSTGCSFSISGRTIEFTYDSDVVERLTALGVGAVSTTAYSGAHVHSFGAGWTSDGTAHWHECADCGSRADYAKHTPSADVPSECSVCGAEIKTASGGSGGSHIGSGVGEYEEETLERAGEKAYKISAPYIVPTLEVTVPVSLNAVINPYRIALDSSGGSAEGIASPEYTITNNSDVYGINIAALASASGLDAVVDSESKVLSADGVQSKNAYIVLRATPVSNGGKGDYSDIDNGDTDKASELVFREEAEKFVPLMRLGASSAGYFQIGGSVPEEPDEKWTSSDKLTLNVIFDITPYNPAV